jgi:hypothetical protein
MNPYATLATCQKAVPRFQGWAIPEDGQRGLWFETPLVIGGFLEQGLTLKGAAIINRPNANVTFEIRVTGASARRSFALMRACWRSLKGGHSNQRRWRQLVPETEKRTTASHFHPFELNWDANSGRLLGDNLPLAQSIPDTLSTFAEFRQFVAQAFNISNMHVVSEPPWEYSLELLGGEL